MPNGFRSIVLEYIMEGAMEGIISSTIGGILGALELDKIFDTLGEGKGSNPPSLGGVECVLAVTSFD